MLFKKAVLIHCPKESIQDFPCYAHACQHLHFGFIHTCVTGGGGGGSSSIVDVMWLCGAYVNVTWISYLVTHVWKEGLSVNLELRDLVATPWPKSTVDLQLFLNSIALGPKLCTTSPRSVYGC